MSAPPLVDAAGVVHRPLGAGDAPARIVSLVPSLTETLCALGLSEQLVGRTGFCIHPGESVRRIPKVGGTKTVKLEAIRALRPTHLIVNIDENEKPTVDALREFIPHIIVTHPLAPCDNPPLYRLLGGLFGKTEQAQALCAAFAQRLSVLTGMAWPARRALYLIWRDPWMTVARTTYISAMLELVHWHTQPSAAASRYPAFELDAPWLAEVELVLLSSEPYRFGATHLAELGRDVRLAGKQICLIDGEMLSWYGARAIDGLAYLADFAVRANAAGQP